MDMFWDWLRGMVYVLGYLALLSLAFVVAVGAIVFAWKCLVSGVKVIRGGDWISACVVLIVSIVAAILGLGVGGLLLLLLAGGLSMAAH